MAEIEKGAKKGLNKGALEAWIDGKESNFGPLVKINVATGGTVGTFDDDLDSPSTKPLVILNPTPSQTCPSPKSEVCRGRAYISGVIQNVQICR